MSETITYEKMIAAFDNLFETTAEAMQPVINHLCDIWESYQRSIARGIISKYLPYRLADYLARNLPYRAIVIIVRPR